MSKSKENNFVIRKKKMQIEFKEDNVTINDGKLDESPRQAQESENVSNLESTRDINDTDSVKPNTYTTELPFPIEEKTSIMKQVLSGMERMLKIVKSAFRRAISWITSKIRPVSEEEV